MAAADTMRPPATPGTPGMNCMVRAIHFEPIVHVDHYGGHLEGR